MVLVNHGFVPFMCNKVEYFKTVTQIFSVPATTPTISILTSQALYPISSAAIMTGAIR